jgi:hypothetical protein
MRTGKRAAGLSLACAVAASFACTAATPTQLTVLVDVEDGLDVNEVRLVIERGSTTDLQRVQGPDPVPIGAATRFPLEWAIVHEGGDRRVTVTVTGTRDDDAPVVARAHREFEPGETRLQKVCLRRACVGNEQDINCVPEASPWDGTRPDDVCGSAPQPDGGIPPAGDASADALIEAAVADAGLDARVDPQPDARSPDAEPPVQPPSVGGCPIFPPDNEWNQDVSKNTVHPLSAAYVASMNTRTTLGLGFGPSGTLAQPWITVPQNQARVAMSFTAANESDPGPYPFPVNAPVGPSFAQVIVIQLGTCKLFEGLYCMVTGASWSCFSGAIFDLSTNALRPKGWTSADGAGLPIFPGLVRLAEVEAGAINHAVRFTAMRSQAAYIRPARHKASNSNDTNLPPMGLRMRLRADFDVTGYAGAARVILIALQKHGMLLAQHGADWSISGEANPGWSRHAADLASLSTVPAAAFEAVYTHPIER